MRKVSKPNHTQNQPNLSPPKTSPKSQRKQLIEGRNDQEELEIHLVGFHTLQQKLKAFASTSSASRKGASRALQMLQNDQGRGSSEQPPRYEPPFSVLSFSASANSAQGHYLKDSLEMAQEAEEQR